MDNDSGSSSHLAHLDHGYPLMRALVLALAIAMLIAGCATPRASLPVFSPGPLTNLADTGNENSVDRARTNAAAHVGWAWAIPLAGYYTGGRSGMRWAALGWIAETLVSESLFHAPPGNLGPAYSSEVRTDLLSRLAPTLILLSIDWLLQGD